MYWETMMFFIFFASLIILPLNVINHGLTNHFTEIESLSVLTTASDIVCLADIVMTFFTGYEDEGKVILKPKLIKR